MRFLNQPWVGVDRVVVDGAEAPDDMAAGGSTGRVLPAALHE